MFGCSHGRCCSKQKFDADIFFVMKYVDDNSLVIEDDILRIVLDFINSFYGGMTVIVFIYFWTLRWEKLLFRHFFSSLSYWWNYSLYIHTLLINLSIVFNICVSLLANQFVLFDPFLCDEIIDDFSSMLLDILSKIIRHSLFHTR